MADPYRKLAIGRVLIRTAFAIGMLAWLFKYGIDRSVTLGNFIEAVQATPLALVLFLDAMDYFVDRTAYYRMYNLVYQRMTGGR
ncbi:hypothetical protein [Thermococcus barophilus]|uniref:hypothetical protein n=1 Tax=Thermococcus barophilus TaxID=55802 RepID=UPI00070486A4|nr:hypothetical protein [Thermococcus barophilus]